MAIPTNKYGVWGSNKIMVRPYEIEPDLFDGRNGGKFDKLTRRGQKGWLLSGTIGLVGGSISAKIEKKGEPWRLLSFSPVTDPGKSFEIELGIDPLFIENHGMLDNKFELLVRRIY